MTRADQASAVVNDEAVDRPQDELRLFIDYLRGDYKEAEADLDVMAGRAASADSRFRLLALRAQILHAREMTPQSSAILDYLLKVQGGPVRRIEETPAGPVLTPVEESGRTWTRYLAQRLSEKSAALKPSPGDPADTEETIDLRLPVPMDGFDGRLNDGPFQPPPRRIGPGGFAPGMVPGPGAGRMGGGPMGPGIGRPQRRFAPPPLPPQPAQPEGRFPRRFRPFDRGQAPGE